MIASSLLNQNMVSSLTSMLAEFFDKQVPQEKLQVEALAKKDLAFLEHMVIMLLTNAQIRMFLKIHFHLDAAKHLTSVKQNKKPSDINERAALDYMKELCNVLGGRLKRRIAHLDLELGQSIPLDLDGFSEIFFEDVNWSSETIVFRIANEKIKILVSAQYEITGTDARKKLESLTEQTVSDDEDDIEFL